MEGFKLPIMYWIIAIQPLTTTSDNFSIEEIQEKINGAEKESSKCWKY